MRLIMNSNKIMMIIVAALLIVSTVYSIYAIFNNDDDIEEEEDTNTMLSEVIEDECTEEYQEMQNTTPVAWSTEKLSANAILILKKYYIQCEHTINEYVELPQELVNLTEEELEAYYKDWEIEEFSPSKIILTKEINSLCDEHFIIKLGEKYVQVFHLEPDGNLVVYETTDISREYLPEEDIKKLEEGIYVFGEGKLNSVLEDFE